MCTRYAIPRLLTYVQSRTLKLLSHMTDLTPPSSHFTGCSVYDLHFLAENIIQSITFQLLKLPCPSPTNCYNLHFQYFQHKEQLIK